MMLTSAGWMIPFVLLLAAIAFAPLCVPRWWERNVSKALVGAVCTAPVVWWFAAQDFAMLQHTLAEYFSFIIFLTALFIIAGGIAVTGDLPAHPRTNTIILGIGALLASVIGTTGASMVLIRVLLRTNRERKRVAHLPVLFILLVSNAGGLLTPIGDPPLFLGFLRGVPFFWTLRLWPVWLLTCAWLLSVTYVWDRRAYAQETRVDRARDDRDVEPINMCGAINFVWLGGVILSVFFPSPWRECEMLMCAAASLLTTPRAARTHNQFSWHPIIEVATLFAAIFLTMRPALAWLSLHAAQLGVVTPAQFFWTSGALSSVLDNAPTYATFLALAQGLHVPATIIGVPANILAAISVGSVLMGANTYLGNAPNFMVKSLADRARIHMPNFFHFTGQALLLMTPIYLAIWWWLR